MENFQTLLKEEIKVAFSDVFSYDCPLENISIDETPKNFVGFYTLVIFPHLKYLNCSPEEAGAPLLELSVLQVDRVRGRNLMVHPS